MARSERRRTRAPRTGPAGTRARQPRSTEGGEAVVPVGPPAGPTGVRPTPQRRRFNPFGWMRRFEPRAVADVLSELRKVTWPTAGETRYLTFVVAVVAVAVGIVLGIFDLFFGWAIEQVFFN